MGDQRTRRYRLRENVDDSDGNNNQRDECQDQRNDGEDGAHVAGWMPAPANDLVQRLDRILSGEPDAAASDRASFHQNPGHGCHQQEQDDEESESNRFVIQAANGALDDADER
mgnify:CR=1 FL=1